MRTKQLAVMLFAKFYIGESISSKEKVTNPSIFEKAPGFFEFSQSEGRGGPGGE